MKKFVTALSIGATLFAALPVMAATPIPPAKQNQATVRASAKKGVKKVLKTVMGKKVVKKVMKVIKKK